jgi:hypothetical protein
MQGSGFLLRALALCRVCSKIQEGFTFSHSASSCGVKRSPGSKLTGAGASLVAAFRITISSIQAVLESQGLQFLAVSRDLHLELHEVPSSAGFLSRYWSCRCEPLALWFRPAAAFRKNSFGLAAADNSLYAASFVDLLISREKILTAP